MVRGMKIMTKRKPTTRKRRTAAKHSAWKPGWYRRMELRKRHVEQELAREDKSGIYNRGVPAGNCDYREWRQGTTLRG